jgi:hypothetical protein
MKLLLLAALLCSALAFHIEEKQAVGDVTWPYTACNADAINITGLALTTQPAKNKNITAKVTGKALAKVSGK